MLLFASLCMNNRNFPSGDQDFGRWWSADFNTSSSLPTPLESFQYIWLRPWSRWEANARRLPSGDQTGSQSIEASNVNFVGTLRCTSKIQISTFPESCLVSATQLPSGESVTSLIPPAGPTFPKYLPVRSSHTIRFKKASPFRYAKVPFGDTEKDDLTASAKGTASPVNSSFLSSKGWAINVPSRLNNK